VNKNLIKEIALTLEKGSVAILPTDTVYGLFCSALSRTGANAVYKIKGRERSKPLQLFFPDAAAMLKYVDIPDGSKKKVGSMLPGPYTVILNLKARHKKTFSFLKSGTAGVRIVRSPLINSIIRELKGPIAATSANVSGEKTPVKFADIDAGIINKVGFAINDDKTVKGRASRVIDMTSKAGTIIRR
jgi:tRNA threonylcarbamoyl adenosine modification protein (Sua5/YciO/YrdC/YwlC family)